MGRPWFSCVLGVKVRWFFSCYLGSLDPIFVVQASFTRSFCVASTDYRRFLVPLKLITSQVVQIARRMCPLRAQTVKIASDSPGSKAPFKFVYVKVLLRQNILTSSLDEERRNKSLENKNRKNSTIFLQTLSLPRINSLVVCNTRSQQYISTLKQNESVCTLMLE